MTDLNNIDDLFREQQDNWVGKPDASSWEKLSERLDERSAVTINRRKKKLRWLGAACIIGLLGIGLFIFNKNIVYESDLATVQNVSAPSLDPETGSVTKMKKRQNGSFNDDNLLGWSDKNKVDVKTVDIVIEDNRSIDIKNEIDGLNEEVADVTVVSGSTISGGYSYTDKVELSTTFSDAEENNTNAYQDEDKPSFAQVVPSKSEVKDNPTSNDEIYEEVMERVERLGTVSLKDNNQLESDLTDNSLDGEDGNTEADGYLTEQSAFANMAGTENTIATREGSDQDKRKDKSRASKGKNTQSADVAEPTEYLPAQARANAFNTQIQRSDHLANREEMTKDIADNEYTGVDVTTYKTVNISFPLIGVPDCDSLYIKLNKPDYQLDHCGMTEVQELTGHKFLESIYNTPINDLRKLEAEAIQNDCYASTDIDSLQIIIEYMIMEEYFNEIICLKWNNNCARSSIQPYLNKFRRLLDKK